MYSIFIVIATVTSSNLHLVLETFDEIATTSTASEWLEPLNDIRSREHWRESTYAPSALEQDWILHADHEQWLGDVCSRDRSLVSLWVAQVQNHRPAEEVLDESVFSIMGVDSRTGQPDYIEPLAYYLRSPLYPCVSQLMIERFCCSNSLDPDVAKIMDLGPAVLPLVLKRYLPDDASEASALSALVPATSEFDRGLRLAQMIKAAAKDKSHIVLSGDHVMSRPGDHRRAYLFDVGSSYYAHSFFDPHSSTNWFVEAYAKRGIHFSGIFCWEAEPLNLTMYWEEVPEELRSSVHFFNRQADSELYSENNPIQRLRQVCEPEDFCAIKIDVDERNLESAWLKQILTDREVQARIDELFLDAADMSEVGAWPKALGNQDAEEGHLDVVKLVVKEVDSDSETVEADRMPPQDGLDAADLRRISSMGWMQPSQASFRILQLLRTLGIRTHGWV